MPNGGFPPIFLLPVTSVTDTSLTASYSDGSISTTVNLTANIGSSPPGNGLSITPTQLNPGTVGVPYNEVQFQANGGSGDYSWAWTGNLPPGMELTQAGELQGTPTQQGNYPFTVNVTDLMSGATASQQLTLVVNGSSTCGAPGPLTIVGRTDFGRIDPRQPFSPETYTAQGGDCPNYTWMPANPFFGLSFSCSGQTCILSGTPIGATEPNSNVFFEPLIVKDDKGGFAKVVLSGEIQIPNPPPPLKSIGPIVDHAYVGLLHTFSEFITGVTGGRGPYICTANQLTIDGLTLYSDGQNCWVRGTPTAAETVSFTVQIEDQTDQPPVSVTVNIQALPCSQQNIAACGPPPIVPDVDSTTPHASALSAAVRRKVRSYISAGAKQSISAGGVVDAASYQPLMTPGGIMSIFGTGMANGTSQASATPLPLLLGDVQVTVNGENAPLFYVSPTQINFQAPLNPVVYYASNPSCLQSGLDPATFSPDNCPPAPAATVMVIASGVAIAAVSVPMSTSAPVVFTLPDSTVIATHSNNQSISQSSPAQAGEVIVIYGSGLGYPTCSLVAGYPSGAGCLANTAPQFTFPDYPSLNNSTSLLFAGLTPGSVGLAQFNLQLPSSFPSSATSAGSIRIRIGDPVSGETFRLYLPVSASSGSTPTVVTSLISNTNGIVNGSCVSPPSITTFFATSPQVWIYFNVAGATVGDSASIVFVRPDGVTYASVNASVSYTSECFAYSTNISGAPAASFPGQWTVNVYWNQSATPLFSLNFTLSSITFVNQVVSTQAPPPSGCSQPPSVTSFPTTAGTVYLFFQATVTSSDGLTNDWLGPNGSSYGMGSWPPNSGTYCFTGANLNIANTPQDLLGSWQARVFDNGNLLFSIPFSITAP